MKQNVNPFLQLFPLALVPSVVDAFPFIVLNFFGQA